MKTILASLDEVAEPLRSEYELRDGRYTLKIEGDAPPGFVPEADSKNRIAEFRDKNISLLKELDAVKVQLATAGTGDAVALRAKVAELEAALKAKPSRNDELMAAIAPLKSQIESLTAANEKAVNDRKAAERSAAIKGLENRLALAGQKAGIDERAIDDFVMRGMRVFELDDEGKIIAKVNGTPVYSKKDPGTLLAVEEWAPSLKDTAPHLFKPSTGGGANGAGHALTGGSKNPTAKQLINPTPQELGQYASAIRKGEMVVVHQ